MGYIFCSAATLVPTPLFDFRYFTVQWVLLCLEINGLRPVAAVEKSQSDDNDIKKKVILKEKLNVKLKIVNIVGFMVINAIVLHVFRNKPFKNEFFGGEMSRMFW